MSDLLTFTDCLLKTGLELGDIRLLRHQAKEVSQKTPYSLWVEDANKLNKYQSTQKVADRTKFKAPFWCSFVATPDGGTTFVGIFKTERIGKPDEKERHQLSGLPFSAQQCEEYDLYSCRLTHHLSDYIGRLHIDWGKGLRSWNQLATSKAGRAKTIEQINREFQEPDFPGLSKFIAALSEVPCLPASWQTILQNSKGIYLLSCPKTKEQYVGKAVGNNGFLGRWLDYCASGHGGNVGLKQRDRSDYQVSILEVGGSSTSEAEYDQLENLWKKKLQSREMGLNRN